jgi:RNA polymerase sigma factor FliA
MAWPLPYPTYMTNTAAALQVSADHPSPRSEVIERCLPLVKSITARLRLAHGLNAPFDDIYEIGVDGLMEASERFDPARGVAFTTFAYYRIRGAILDSLRRDPERLFTASGHRATSTAANGASAQLHAANDNGSAGGAIRAPEAEHGTWRFSDPETVLLASLDELGSLPDETAPHLDEEVERRWLAKRIQAALGELPEIERRVIELHYYEDLSFSEIGAQLGICKPWAFRLHNKAIRQLRQELGELAGLALAALSA